MKKLLFVMTVALLFTAQARAKDNHELKFCYPMHINTGGGPYHMRGGFVVVTSEQNVFAGPLLSLDTAIRQIEGLQEEMKCLENYMESCIVEGKFLKIGTRVVASFAYPMHAEMYAKKLRDRKICL